MSEECGVRRHYQWDGSPVKICDGICATQVFNVQLSRKKAKILLSVYILFYVLFPMLLDTFYFLYDKITYHKQSVLQTAALNSSTQ